MKNGCFLIIFGVTLLLAGGATAEPFAPLVELPEDISSSSISFLEAQTVEKSVVPEAEEVGVPAYPGAKILFTQTGNRATIKGQSTLLPDRVFLGTTAPLEKVVGYYTDFLEGWSQFKENGSTIFYNGDETDDPRQDLTAAKIHISPDDSTRNTMPEAKTNIDIYYHSARHR